MFLPTWIRHQPLRYVSHFPAKIGYTGEEVVVQSQADDVLLEPHLSSGGDGTLGGDAGDGWRGIIIIL